MDAGRLVNALFPCEEEYYSEDMKLAAILTFPKAPPRTTALLSICDV